MPVDVDPITATISLKRIKALRDITGRHGVDHARSRRLEGASAPDRVRRAIRAMPLYEWGCRVCDLTFEALVAASASKRKRACPHCHRPSARVMSAARFHSGKAAPPLEYEAGRREERRHPAQGSEPRADLLDGRSICLAPSRLQAWAGRRIRRYDGRASRSQEEVRSDGEAGLARTRALSSSGSDRRGETRCGRTQVGGEVATRDVSLDELLVAFTATRK